jgi:hypothetical protein
MVPGARTWFADTQAFILVLGFALAALPDSVLSQVEAGNSSYDLFS